MPSKTFTSAVDLGSLIAANDNQLPSEIPVLPKGEFMTLPYGNMVLDDRVFDEMIANLQRKVRRRTPVDIDHCANGETKAAGWIESLINKADGLYATVKWNKIGKELVGEEIYKMISAEWSFDYVDPQKSTHHGAVLVAATLTNRPLMQSMPTITASEDLTNPNKIMLLFNEDSKTNKTMPTIAEILLKPVADRTEDDVKFLQEHESEFTDEQKTQLETEKVESDKVKEDEKKKVEDAENEAKEAAESGDVEACKAALIKAGNTEDEAVTASEKMVADAKAAKENVTITASELKRLQSIEEEKKASDIKVAAESYSAEFLASDKGGKVAPAGKEALIKLASTLNDEQKALLKSVLTATADQTITKVAGEDDESGLAATDKYNNLVKKYMSEGKSPSEANRLVKAEHKEVYDLYVKENK